MKALSPQSGEQEASEEYRFGLHDLTPIAITFVVIGITIGIGGTIITTLSNGQTTASGASCTYANTSTRTDRLEMVA